MIEWSYDQIADWYDDDMCRNMPFDDLAGYRLLMPPPPADVLEVGCGTGRLTLPLADAGYQMTGLDRSAPMLNKLAEKLSNRHTIVLSHQDAKTMHLGQRYDVILFAYSGFQYLLNDVDIASFCHQARALLRPDGILIVDIFLHQAQIASGQFRQDYDRQLSDGTWLSRSKRVRLDGNVNRVERRYVWRSGVAAPKRCDTISRQRIYTPTQLVATLASCGFDCNGQLFDYESVPTAATPNFFTARFVDSESL